MNQLFIVIVVLTVAVSGCHPAMFSPPPQWPAGGQPGNQMIPIPAQPQTIPQTFAPTNPTTPQSLDDVATVPADEVLKLPPTPRDIKWHDVRPNDTLSSIARKHSVTVDVLMEANGFDTPPTLTVGQQIRIP
jgi:LysM repeat protein